MAIGQLEAEFLAVREESHDIADAATTEDKHALDDAHLGKCLEREVDHRPVVDRQQVLVGDDRHREQAGGGTASEDESLHRR